MLHKWSCIIPLHSRLGFAQLKCAFVSLERPESKSHDRPMAAGCFSSRPPPVNAVISVSFERYIGKSPDHSVVSPLMDSNMCNLALRIAIVIDLRLISSNK